jgi:hypothetical protein
MVSNRLPSELNAAKSTDTLSWHFRALIGLLVWASKLWLL